MREFCGFMGTLEYAQMVLEDRTDFEPPRFGNDSLTDRDRLALEHGVRRIWQARTGAHRVELAELRSSAGAAHYLTNHHSKRSQLPPAGWTGRRYRPTRGYFALPAPERRLRAKEALLHKNLARRVRQTLLADPELVDVDGEQWNELLAADLAQARSIAAQGVTLVRVQEVPVEFGPDGLPTRKSRSPARRMPIAGHGTARARGRHLQRRRAGRGMSHCRTGRRVAPRPCPRPRHGAVDHRPPSRRSDR